MGWLGTVSINLAVIRPVICSELRSIVHALLNRPLMSSKGEPLFIAVEPSVTLCVQ
jgi:hypothetical protein